MKHLWEVEHPYYCSESNYYAPTGDTYFTYDSWEEFYDEMSSYDMDLNLIFRWDWDKVPEEDLDGYEEGEYTGDTLQLFYMMQRKGIFACHQVKVTEDDEPAVREFLSGYWRKMQQLWEPFGV